MLKNAEYRKEHTSMKYHTTLESSRSGWSNLGTAVAITFGSAEETLNTFHSLYVFASLPFFYFAFFFAFLPNPLHSFCHSRWLLPSWLPSFVPWWAWGSTSSSKTSLPSFGRYFQRGWQILCWEGICGRNTPPWLR